MITDEVKAVLDSHDKAEDEAKVDAMDLIEELNGILHDYIGHAAFARRKMRDSSESKTPISEEHYKLAADGFTKLADRWRIEWERSEKLKKQVKK